MSPEFCRSCCSGALRHADSDAAILSTRPETTAVVQPDAQHATSIIDIIGLTLMKDLTTDPVAPGPDAP